MIFKSSAYLKQLAEVTGKVKKINNRNKVSIVSDIIMSTLLYGASPNNYLFFRFEKLDHNKRKTYLTSKDSNKLMNYFNDKSFSYTVDNKTTFASLFSDFFSREWLNIQSIDFQSFKEFMEDKESIMCKPLVGGQGRGIEVISKDSFENITTMYEYITDSNNDFSIAEELIVQHKDLSNIYSDSINTIRIMTIQSENKTHILQAMITFGNGSPIANQRMGGMASPIELESGIIKKPSVDLENNLYNKHPKTDVPIVEFRIPYWKETIAMISEASKIVPQMRYLGWDIAITPTGPVIIETNSDPGYTKLQNPLHLENNIGNRNIYESIYLSEKSKNRFNNKSK